MAQNNIITPLEATDGYFVRIPEDVIVELDWAANDDIELVVEDDAIVIKNASTEYTLEQRLDDITDKLVILNYRLQHIEESIDLDIE